MGKYLGPVCKLCRRERTKLFLKGTRCITKCALDRRDTTPGEHNRKRTKQSGYALQLREKQKAKRIYGIYERQFKNYFVKAARMPGATGENLLSLLERRLDNVIYLSGIGLSRNQARQYVRHGMFKINGHTTNIPSLLVKEGDVISFKKEETAKNSIIQSAVELSKGKQTAEWLELDADKMAVTINRLPVRQDISTAVKESMIVELYSK